MPIEEFVRCNYRNLLRTAFLLTGDRFAAEDLLQEALAKTWRYSQSERSIEQPGAFIRRVLLNEYLSQRRRPFREQVPEPERLPERQSHDVSAEFQPHDAMWNALAQLPHRQRAVLVLKFYENLGEREIADVLDITIGTVRSTSWRGLDSLRKVMATSRKENDARRH